MNTKNLFSLAIAGLLTACSSDNDTGNEEPGFLADEFAKIEVGVSTGIINTRGTGSVGGVTTDENHWSGQAINIYMLEKDAMKLALFGLNGEKEVIFDNKKFIAPSGKDDEGNYTNSNTGLATAEDLTIAYYPQNGNFDFWGYRVDDAGTGSNGVAVPEFRDGSGNKVDVSGQKTVDDKNKALEKATCIVVPFNIDGTQDIMSGRAANGTELAKTGDLPDGLKADRVYSASSARKGLQPNVSFNHHLTRFTFHVIPGNPSAAGIDTTKTSNTDATTGAIYVDTIKMMSKTQGELYVAYKTTPKDGVCQFTDNTTTPLYLKQRSVDAEGEALLNSNLKTLEPVKLTWTYDIDPETNEALANHPDTIKVGEALLVAPGEMSYPLTLCLSQKAASGTDANGNPTSTETKKFSFTANITLNNTAFTAGSSYDITIKVYCLEKIGITATLQPWSNGGNINIDTDSEEVIYEEPTK